VHGCPDDHRAVGLDVTASEPRTVSLDHGGGGPAVGAATAGSTAHRSERPEVSGRLDPVDVADRPGDH